MKRAVFFDIDGTLIDCLNDKKTISVEVKRAIRMLQLNGDLVFVATGRPYAFLNQEILEFGFDGFVLANGSQVIMNEKTIYKEVLDKNFVSDAVQTFEKYQMQYILEADYYAYMPKRFKEFYAFYERIGIAPSELIKAEYNLEQVEAQKIEVRCPDEKARKYCLDFIGQYPEYGYYQSIDDHYVEIYAKENSKAKGILEALKYLDIPVENSFAFGDGQNDIEMLEAAGCGIAMGNASESVKKYADVITETVGNDGVAVGIYKYILKEEAKSENVS